MSGPLSLASQHVIHLYISVCSHSVLSDYFRPHRLQPIRLLPPWNFPGKSTGVGCHFLLHGIFPAQGSNPGLPHCRQILFTIWATRVTYIWNIYVCIWSSMCAQSCPTLYHPVNCSPPGSSVHGISQARILEWVTISSCRGSSWPRDRISIFCVSCIDR